MRIKFRIAIFLFVVAFAMICNRSSAADSISLAGNWRFALDASDSGIRDQWFDRDLADKIALPGILQAQGYGKEISIETPWVLSLYDHLWFLRADYSTYTNAGNVKVPFLSQPPRHYLGAAWYQRDIEIPPDWKGRRVVLFLERPHWESRVWLDDTLIGTNNSLCAPHEYELGVGIMPGKHRLTVRVDNRMILPYRPDAHSVSDSLGGAWNGIVGKMELRASDNICIERLRLDPDLKRAGVVVTLFTHNGTDKPAEAPLVRLQVIPKNFDGNALPPLQKSAVIPPGDTNLTLFFPMGEHFEQWSEFNPKIYNLRATIGGKGFHSEIAETFGMRNFRAEGNQFILNGREIYLRGTHNGGDFPLTGYPPTDVASWKKIFQTCKNYGLNHMRFHSWFPPEAAFEAADEMGFYLQPECGMWNSISPGSAMEKMLYLETDRIIKVYGNHPSFIMLSAMNEAHGNWKPSLAKWVEHFRALDPRRLYTPDTGWSAINEPGPVKDADYLSVGRIGSHRVRGESAWFGGDYSESLKGVNVPVLAHELGQWCAYPDFDVIKKFTGYLRPGNYEIFRDSAEAHGVLSQNKNFARASGEFQLECYKEEIEANLRTPGMAGFQLLDLHDYLGQGTALVGLLDTFWESKGYALPEEFKKFCNTVVPLARLKKRVFTTTDSFDVPVEIANFSQSALTNATVIWRILDRNGNGRAIGISNGHDIPIGKNELEKISENFASLHLPAPAQYKLQIYLQGTPFTNDWNFWLYPAEISDAAPTNVFITSSWPDAEKKLSDGGNVLFLPRNSDLDWTSPPLARVPIFWNRLMNPGWSRMLGLWCDTNSPALAEFPTDENCDWQWTELLRNTRAINLDKLPRGLHPIVSAIDDWNRNYKLGVIFEAKVGSGKLLVCSIDLNRNSSPVARQLRRSLLDYMSGKNFKPKADAFDSVFGDKSADKFQPQTEISLTDFESLHFDSRIMRELGATATGEGAAGNALDGDPNTYWIAGGGGRNQSGTKHPHELIIRFPENVAMNGVVLMPRQNDRDHLGDVREYKIEASGDGSQWREIASGELASTWSPQRVEFGKTISTKQLKFTALSGFGNDTSAALAELAVMYAGSELTKNASGEIEYRKSRSTSTDVDE